ncbi:MAG: acetylornithine deacetylase [Wenzhouxiangella sp.]
MKTSSELLARLVGFRTVSRDSNLGLLDWVEDMLGGWGARCRRTWNGERTKANLWASFGPHEPGGVVLSGHTDVVPVDGQNWSSDPFTLVERDGRLYGRGSTDMKGFIAAVLAVLRRSDLKALRQPLHLALSYDEEVGCLGVDRMVEDALAAGIRPDYAVIGEPTTMQIVSAHKSINVFRTRVSGKAAHSSQPHRGAGAILAAGRMIEQLYRIGEEKRAAAGVNPCDPPWTTVQVGLIQGGHAVNILPSECEFAWEYRALPDEDPDEIIDRMQSFAAAEVLPALREFAPEAEVCFDSLARVPPLVSDSRNRAERWVGSLPGVREGGSGAVSFATEAGSFQRAGIPSVVCGPGSIDQAHQPNEFIETVELERCERMVEAIIGRLS